MNNAVSAPNITFNYQGAYLSMHSIGTLGPFRVSPAEQLGFGYAVAQDTLSKVPVTSLRTASIKENMTDVPDTVVQMGYLQNDTEWLMTFSVLSDPQGGAIGTDVELLANSNYPQIPMNIPRTRIDQKGVNFLVKGILPANYRAQLVLRFWNNGLDRLPLDSWISVQVGYVQVEPGQQRSLQPGVSIPLVTVAETLLYPAPGSGDRKVLGDNYPKRDRFAEPRILTM